MYYGRSIPSCDQTGSKRSPTCLLHGNPESTLPIKKKLINANLATSLINWKHSGFSLDCSVRIGSHSDKARKALSQYISRRMAVPPPLSLKKMSIQENGEATVISYTSNNEFFQGKTEPFSVTRFLLEVTQHIPPRGSQYIRRYGLYAPQRRTARTKGKWPDMPHVMRLAPAGWKAERPGRAV